MPDTLLWTGATDTDPSKTANYLLQSGTAWAAASSIPVNGDTLLLANTAVNFGGGSTLASVTLAALTAFPTFTGTFGTAASPVQLGTTTLLNWRSGGTVAYVNGAVTTLNVDTLPGRRYIQTGGTVTNMRTARGQVTVGTGSAVTNILNGSGEIDLEQNGTAVTLAINSGGRLSLADRGVTTYKSGRGSSLYTTGVVASTTVDVASGAVWNHRSRGTSTTVNLLGGGQITVANSEGAATFGTLYEWAGSRLIDDSAGSRLTVSTRVAIGSIMQAGGAFPISGG